MTCESCEAAKANPQSGMMNANCLDCKAREIARSQQWFDAQKAGDTTPEYRALLRTVFGRDGARDGHERVKEWAKTMEAIQYKGCLSKEVEL